MDFRFFFLISFLEIQRWQPAGVFVHAYCSYLLIQKNVSENFQENLFLSSGPEKFPSRLELGMWKEYHSSMEGIPKGYLFWQKMEYIKRVRVGSRPGGACETEGWYEAHPLLPCLSNRLFCKNKLKKCTLSVNVFSKKELTGDTRDGNVILRGHPSQAKV